MPAAEAVCANLSYEECGLFRFTHAFTPAAKGLALGWGLAAAVGAVAGMMVAPVIFLDSHMMSGVLLYAFASALLGGIDNPWGAAAGGLIVGLLENLLGAYVIGTDLKLTMALA